MLMLPIDSYCLLGVFFIEFSLEKSSTIRG